MKGFAAQLAVTLRLYFRNTMALIYGYLFPTIFLVAFWVLYRYDQAPIIRHVGELLTVTVLGGACFGLPTSLVSERERGVWRRYRQLPVATRTLVVSTNLGRYVKLLTAGLLQLGLALAIGMPFPRHPVELWIAFTCVSFAFLGLGLVIAMLADNVPAVQALGQCIFLPMLIIGGVAVQLASLPAWAQHLSAFFPGRYAVQALQACASGPGLAGASFDVAALLLIGAAGCVAGARTFRWDAQQRFLAGGGKGWVGVALAAWVAVGAMAEARGTATLGSIGAAQRTPAVTTSAPPPPAPAPAHVSPPQEAPAASSTPAPAPAEHPRAQAARASSAPTRPVPPAPKPATETAAAAPREETAAASPSTAPPVAEPSSWQQVTRKNIDADLVFNRLPPDSGVVTPIARDDEQPEPDVASQLDAVAAALPTWAPGNVADPVQRVRNYLYVAAVPDVLQMPVERFLPWLVFDRLQQVFPNDQLIKLLYWVAVHPMDGDDSAANDLSAFGWPQAGADPQEVRGRAGVYAVKLLGRLTGEIK
jgi:hypothetical protein